MANFSIFSDLESEGPISETPKPNIASVTLPDSVKETIAVNTIKPVQATLVPGTNVATLVRPSATAVADPFAKVTTPQAAPQGENFSRMFDGVTAAEYEAIRARWAQKAGYEPRALRQNVLGERRTTDTIYVRRYDWRYVDLDEGCLYDRRLVPTGQKHPDTGDELVIVRVFRIGRFDQRQNFQDPPVFADLGPYQRNNDNWLAQSARDLGALCRQRHAEYAASEAGQRRLYLGDLHLELKCQQRFAANLAEAEALERGAFAEVTQAYKATRQARVEAWKDYDAETDDAKRTALEAGLLELQEQEQALFDRGTRLRRQLEALRAEPDYE